MPRVARSSSPPPSGPLRIAIYLRISKDPDGTSTATQRQLRDCKRFAALKRWKVAGIFEDVDVSAYNERTTRPQYEEMLAAIAEGEFDGVLVWKLDRLVRRVSEFERFWTVCEGAGAILASFSESIDSTNELGMLIVRILVAFAQMESATTGIRLRAVEAERARLGKPKVGGIRPYGISADWLTLVPHEAKIIQEMAERILAGDSPRSIAVDLNARNIPTSRGKRWVTVSVRSLLVQERLWGERTYNGETFELIGVPTILDKATGAALKAKISYEWRRRTGEKIARKHLLTGLLVCSKCGTKMTGNGYKYRGGGHTVYARYGCPGPPEGCGKTTIALAQVDGFVSEMVLYRLNSSEMATMLKARKGRASRDAELMAELAGAEARSRELDSLWASGELSMERANSRQREINRVIEDLSAQLAVQRQASALGRALSEPKGIRDAWDTMPVERKRAVIDALLEKVIVLPGERGRQPTPDRLAPVWKV